jgi:hypothetical protein
VKRYLLLRSAIFTDLFDYLRVVVEVVKMRENKRNPGVSSISSVRQRLEIRSESNLVLKIGAGSVRSRTFLPYVDLPKSQLQRQIDKPVRIESKRWKSDKSAPFWSSNREARLRNHRSRRSEIIYLELYDLNDDIEM